MKDTIEITEIDPSEATDAQLRALHELWSLDELETWPEDPPPPFEEFVAEINGRPSYSFQRFWLATGQESGQPLAYTSIDFERRDTNQHRGHVSIFTHPGSRLQGLTSGLLRPVAEIARKEGRTSLNNWLKKDSPGTGYAKLLGANQTTNDFENRLPIAELDRSLIESWVARAPERAQEYSLEFWEGACPAEYLDSFAQAKQAMNDAPRGPNQEDDVFQPEQVKEWEERHVEAGYLLWTYAAIHEPSGEVAGYTQMFPSPWRPQLAKQEDTGVLPAHRNRGLGRWLKAQMLVKLLEEKPETDSVITWNATINKSMLGINRELGFRGVREWGEWELTLDDLEAWLSAKSGA
ncbi:MAG: GNAT family N-acetyltransferase [Actinobacteria bacterium]|nr:GNAT family N-acetyltransferase [Actinomycetota bacterium]